MADEQLASESLESDVLLLARFSSMCKIVAWKYEQGVDVDLATS